MATTTTTKDSYGRILNEGYGPGAWHGPDLKAALADVTASMAFERPAADRHSIAEIVLHHAYTMHALRERFTGTPPEPFVLKGEDWFTLDAKGKPTWEQVRSIVEHEHAELARIADALETGKMQSPVPEGERLGLVLGATCHAVYHAGQIQLVKRLIAPAL